MWSPTVLWRRIRAWRRLRFTRAGALFTAGTLAVGFAGISTGNNLLYLLLGAMLGAVGVSGWTSERNLRALRVVRDLPAGVPVGRDFRLRYRVTNEKRGRPSVAVEVREPGLAGVAFVACLEPGETVAVSAAARFERRGVRPLEVLTLSTAFPFGLFVKERDVPLPGEVVVWPRSDRRVPDPAVPAAGSAGTISAVGAGGAPQRGEYRGLREFRFGDDARDIHWRRSARFRVPVVREYEPEAGPPLEVTVDVERPAGDAAESALEEAASLCARAVRQGRTFALDAGRWQVEAGRGPAHLRRALDALARVEFTPTEER
ncbi:MAG: DUF58 domain-containing protein [Longimicrobiales bacterium]|nr:DUF58 domain-containing protein [Longimicrobiales bacterium]